MNKYIIGVALVAGLSLSSCSDFLDVQPEGYGRYRPRLLRFDKR